MIFVDFACFCLLLLHTGNVLLTVCSVHGLSSVRSYPLFKSSFKPGTVAYTCNPATQEAEIGKITLQSQTQQKVSESTSQSVTQVWWCTPVIPSYAIGDIGRRIEV
jgi:hypothetical protein